MRQLCLVLLVLVGVGVRQQTPEQVVAAFAAALSKADYDGAAALVKGGKITPELRTMIQKGGPLPALMLSGFSTKIMGATATVSYHLKMKAR